MSIHLILAWTTGVMFLLLLLVIAFVIYVRGAAKQVPHEAMLIFRIVLALAGAGFAAVLPGFLEIEGVWQKMSLRAGGALAAFIVLYFFNPPSYVEQQVVASAKAEKLSGFASRRAALVAAKEQIQHQVSRILAGETVKEIEHNGKTYRVGDRLPIPEHQWVRVMNPNGVANDNGRDEYGDHCSINESGQIEILGFHKDGDEWQVLCAFRTQESRAGAQCGNGAIFFIPI